MNQDLKKYEPVKKESGGEVKVGRTERIQGRTITIKGDISYRALCGCTTLSSIEGCLSDGSLNPSNLVVICESFSCGIVDLE